MTIVIANVESIDNLIGLTGIETAHERFLSTLPESPHAQSAEDVISSLVTDRDGLSPEEASQRLKRFGKNELPAIGRPSLLKLIVRQFKSWLVVLLIAAVVISWIAGEVIDAWVITIVILINAGIGVFHEFRANMAMDALRKMVVEEAKVVRNGEMQAITTDQIVPGDIIFIDEGDLIPADARLTGVSNFRCNESALTGESVPVSKITEEVPAESQIGDRQNMVWKGTFAVSGNAFGVVCATGLETQLGHISRSLHQISDVRSDFLKKTDVLARQMSFIAIGSTVALFLMGYFLRDLALREILLVSIAALVAAIPEGLPAVLAIVLAIGARRMAKRNAIIREFTATETLGAVTAILTDKTGTLTMNSLTVRKVYLPDGRTVDVSGEGLSTDGVLSITGQQADPEDDILLRELLTSAIASNDSRLKRSEGDGSLRLIGDPTEGALRILALKGGIDGTKINKIDDLPFRSEYKYRATLTANGKNILHVVGAPEVLLRLCSHVNTNEGRKEFSKDLRDAVNDTISEWGTKALRVVAVVSKELDSDKIVKEHIGNFTFLGLTGMIDPARPEVNHAIAQCHTAGIRVMMLTGDHINTASAIARNTGILKDQSSATESRAFEQRDLEKLDDDAFDKAITNASVFARLTPQMKLRIVNRLKELGELIAVTGDGVNDAPALKSANVGVAMGVAGTDLARESADVVLADDNFASIVHAVEEGRIVFVNARQTSAFLITTNIAESVTLLVSIGIGLPLPLTATQLLWLNLVTDTMTSISLATEAGHNTLEHSGEAVHQQKLLNRQVIPFLVINVVIMSILAIGALAYYAPVHVELGRTAAFVAMAFTQLFNVFNMRSLDRSVFELGIFSNKFVNWAIAISGGLVILLTYVQPFVNIFKFQPLGPADFILLVLLSSAVLWAGELYKLMVRRHS